MIEAIIRNIHEKTGKTFEEWVELTKSAGLATRRERIAWLKREHELGHVTASVISDEAGGTGKLQTYSDTTALVDNLFSGKNAGLRPVYEELVEAARGLGEDVALTPCKTYVGLGRNRQFAILKPVAGSRVDIGLALKETVPSGRLEAAGSLGGSDRITHRIRIASADDIDEEVRGWLAAAYEGDG
jgi:hypothetical protein